MVSNMFYIDDNLKLIVNYKDKIESIFDYNNNLMGNIYRGRVEKVVKSMNAAFVNIGLDENAYLSLNDANYEIKEGEDILVQIKKVPPENKAARLTMELSVGGRYIVYFPEKSFVKYSSKLNIDEVYRLKELGLKGVLFRTKAKDASNEDILKEYKYLLKFEELFNLERNRKPTPKLIFNKNNFMDYLFKNASESELLTNNKEMYKDLRDIFNISLDEDFSIKYHRDIAKDYKKLFNRKIELSGGGNIVIERTESLSAIDVNTASFTGQSDFEDTIFKNNIEAAKEIARQIILRNISGIIIVDFVDMKSKKYRDILLNLLRDEFKNDISKTIVHGYTKLNLVEISRKNNGEELKSRI